MIKYFLFTFIVLSSFLCFSQDSTSFEVFDPSQYEDGAGTKKYCTQKVLNQVPTKLIGFGYEHNFSSVNSNIDGKTKINSMGGFRATASILAISKNQLIVSIGANYWGSKVHTNGVPVNSSMKQIFGNRMDNLGFNILVFRPLDEKHFLIGQINIDASLIGLNGNINPGLSSLTYFGSAIYGWKKSDYRMLGLGLSRTYRLGRPLIVPILLYNQTFNDKWGVETLLPARAHLRYNLSTNTILLVGYELEGQQFDLSTNDIFLQRGEIKPRFILEQKLKGFFWLSAQLGYRINGRFNLVDKYNGKGSDEILVNNWGGAPYFNISLNFVSP